MGEEFPAFTSEMDEWSGGAPPLCVRGRGGPRSRTSLIG
jgi:hypothetical protein